MAPNQSRPTKVERRQAARAQAQALREEQARRERRNRITRRSLLGVGVAAVAGVGAGLYLTGRDGAGSASYALPTATADTEGVPSVVLADGALTFGQALQPGTRNPGTPAVETWFDYSCPHCAEFERLHSSELTSLATSASATVVLRPVKILGNPWTDLVDNALGLVVDKEPDVAMAFHTAAFSLFEQYVTSANQAYLTVANLVTYARSAGVSEDLSGQFEAAATANTYGPWTALGTETFEKDGLTGTPTVWVNGEAVDLADINTASGITDHLKAQGLIGA